MNDPSKRIDVNISSLLSLKAELLRKQEEVNKAKTKQNISTHVPKKSSKVGKNLQAENETNNNNDTNKTQKIEEYEDSEMLAKSRKVLEAKAKFYDKMSISGGKLNSDDNCLVMFNHKKQTEKPVRRLSSSSSSDGFSDGEDYKAKHPDEEWVEYTDCLGRTRQCLKKDLDFFKKKDTKLAENIQPRQLELNQNAPMWMIDTNGTNAPASEIQDDATEMTSMISKHDQMKMSWEKKEEENAYKENVHYQDVLFDEARTHGVGYYAFSTDEEERAKQRKALDAARDATLNLQKEREAQRLNREKIIAERVKAAKNRRRARLGLPPLEDDAEVQPDPIDTKEEEKRKKREEKEKRRKEKEEKKREEERKHHLRPWDRNKLGSHSNDYSSDSDDEWKYKPEKEPMSQEQWNEMKRTERNPEFAPVPVPEITRNPNRNPFHSQADFITIADNPSETNTLYFTTKKSTRPKEFIKKNSNLLDSSNTDDDCKDRTNSQGGVEIPPPATFEYYGPTSAKRSKTAPRQNLETSIEAGLKFLRDRSDKGILPTKSSWTANADY